VAASEVKEARASFNLGNALADVLTHLFCVSLSQFTTQLSFSQLQVQDSLVYFLVGRNCDCDNTGVYDCRARQHR
jgi:hypothetical protein